LPALLVEASGTAPRRGGARITTETRMSEATLPTVNSGVADRIDALALASGERILQQVRSGRRPMSVVSQSAVDFAVAIATAALTEGIGPCRSRPGFLFEGPDRHWRRRTC